MSEKGGSMQEQFWRSADKYTCKFGGYGHAHIRKLAYSL